MAYQINEFPEGNILYRHTVSNRVVDSPIIEIRYKDYAGYEHPVWPNLYWASDIVIEDLEHSNVEYDYSVDFNTGEPSYTIGNETLDALPPGTYAIKGSLNWADDDSLSNDVYFYHRTTTGSASCWRAGSNDDRYRAINPFTNQLQHYGYYTADDSIDDNLEVYIELGYGLPTQQEDITIGSDYGSVNFQNVTPVVLKRISISEERGIFDTNGTQIGTTINIDTTSPVTCVFKTRKAGDGYTTSWLPKSDWTITNNTNWCTITPNGNGSYTFTANGNNPNTNQISFESDYGTINLYFAYTGEQYRVKIGSDVNSSSMTLYETKTITVQQTSVVDPQESDWVDWTSSDYNNHTMSIQSSNTSVVSVNNSARTISPVSTGTSTVTVSIDGVEKRNVSVTVSTQTLFMEVFKNGTTLVSTGDELGVGNTSRGPYNLILSDNTITFGFYTDLDCQNAVSGITTNSSDSDYSVPSGMIVSPSQNTLTLVPQTTTGSYTIPVYWNGTKLGTVYGTVTTN